ncbi:uncharacterized protein LOC116417827 [Nasonia vitripennis]|uniref:Nuclease HARBI1 n=1 Tax=Nasonia vitripennis TaxID=7425 RepID=A0A7M7QPC8_NASVI|nr:uncharacterized protein LOC116417827 [Nasonia vitripennis]
MLQNMNVALLLFNINQNEVDLRERRQKRAAFRRIKLERKVFRDRSNPFNLEEEHFRQLYRMTPALALDLIRILQDGINDQGVSYIPVHLQVLAALQFFAQGGYQNGISQNYRHPLGRSTFSRCLHRVVRALSWIADDWITFPESREERQQVSNG